MTNVRIFRSQGTYQGFQADGHAGFADAGKDIVCAAISVLSINTVNSIETLAHDQVETLEEDGRLTCRFPEGLSDKGNLLMESLILGLTAIEQSYGRSHIKVEIEEV
jgi:uncharacterized protein YsxB (DUF464 family)